MRVMAHVRVCGGAGWVTTGSTRQLTAPSAGLVALRGVVAWGPPLTAGVRVRPLTAPGIVLEEHHT